MSTVQPKAFDRMVSGHGNGGVRDIRIVPPRVLD